MKGNNQHLKRKLQSFNFWQSSERLLSVILSGIYDIRCRKNLPLQVQKIFLRFLLVGDISPGIVQQTAEAPRVFTTTASPIGHALQKNDVDENGSNERVYHM